MGVISDHLRDLIERQVADKGVVVWYDPDGHYADFAERLNLPETTVELYEDSFFELRHRIEPLMGGFEPPRLVIYVPMDRAETHNALVEAEAAGVVMRPGTPSWILNTRLPVVAKKGLKSTGQWTEKDLEKVAKEIEAGTYDSLEEIEQIATVRGSTTGVLQLIFGTGNPMDIALTFLNDSGSDAKIDEKGAIPKLSQLMVVELDAEPFVDEDTDSYRSRLARHVMATDFLANMSPIPDQLSSVKTASSHAAKDACVSLANTWRSRRDLQESYVDQAIRVENELCLSNIVFTKDMILDTETFLESERSLQRTVVEELIEAAREDLVQIASLRQCHFWSEQWPEVQAGWALVEAAGQLLLEADRIESDLRSAQEDVKYIFAAYTTGERPWYLLDTHQRNMEQRFHDFDFRDADDGLERLVYRARNRYMKTGETLAEMFLHCYHKDGFRIEDALSQTEIFEKMVKPALEVGKTAYIWVDALRFEMAQELVRILSQECDCQIKPAVAAVPTITEIGMAALLPGAQSAKIVPAGDGKLGVEIDGVVLKTRGDRLKFLRHNAPVNVFDVKLDDLLPTPKTPIIKGIEEAGLILVTSQEIDALCEEENIALARRTMDEILLMLQRAFRVLVKLGVKSIIISADHGYIFAEELDDATKIAPPGGNTLDLHRRIWVGHGGAASNSYLRANISDFGLGGELEIAAPWNFSCFRVKGGSKAYFHGGLSPQELIVPVIIMTPKSDDIEEGRNFAWVLDHGGKKLTTRFFSAKISGKAKGISPPALPRIRLELRADGDVISKPISASYGFEDATGDVQLKFEEGGWAIEPSTVTLMITSEELSEKTVSIHLLDAVTRIKLVPSDVIEVALQQY